MPKTRFHTLLEAKIEKAIDDTAASIATGSCADYASYRDQTGYIRGLNDALKLADDIAGEVDS